jgi:recombination protein RecA
MEAALAQFASPGWQSQSEPVLLPSGIPGIQLPRGALTEIYGPASSGRTSLLISLLGEATARQEICALVDAEDAFDPASAAQGGVALDRLIWIRSAHNAEHALKATDLLIQGGGFGLVALDLGDTPPATARRISLTSWFRLRRAVEPTPTVLISLSLQPNARTCASLLIECRREAAAWSGAKPFGAPGRLLRGITVRANATERSKVCSPAFTAQAI